MSCWRCPESLAYLWFIIPVIHFQQKTKITTIMVVTDRNCAMQCKAAWWYKQCLSWRVSTSRTIHGLLRFFLVSLETKLFFSKKSWTEDPTGELFYICPSLPLMTKYQVLELKIKSFKGLELALHLWNEVEFFCISDISTSDCSKIIKKPSTGKLSH